MNIKGVGSNNIINLYSDKQIKHPNKVKELKQDTIELSAIGKNLSSLEREGALIDNHNKVAKIIDQIEKGTYNVDARLTAQGILDAIKGREFK